MANGGDDGQDPPELDAAVEPQEAPEEEVVDPAEVLDPQVRALLRRVRFHFSGPLPHPQILQQYNEALPDGADRVVALAERQSLHRQLLESRGQIFAFVLALVGLLGGIGLIALGKSAEGLVPLISAIGGLVGLFIYTAVQEHRSQAAGDEPEES